jgi:nucleotide-binding universal stress UspA family protein
MRDHRAVYELGTDGPRQILVGVDGSDSSLNAGAYAAGLARRQSSTLVALYVAPTVRVSSAIAATAGIALPGDDDGYGDQLEQLVRQRAAEVGVRVEFVRRAGDPYEELVAVAAELRVDAIVVGASRHAGHRIVGSLAGRLVKNAQWAVTVVP